MFSERWICFCCPQTYKPRRSIVPIEQPQLPPKTFVKKKSDISKIIFIFPKKIDFPLK